MKESGREKVCGDDKKGRKEREKCVM